MDTIMRGIAAEAAVLKAMTDADLPILLPFGQGLAFDLAAVVPPNGDILRIQVKSGRLREGCVVFNTRSTDHGSGQRSYAGRAEIIAVHLPDPDRVFMVPVDECPLSQGNLRVVHARNNQRTGVRLAEDYAFEAWIRGIREGGTAGPSAN